LEQKQFAYKVEGMTPTALREFCETHGLEDAFSNAEVSGGNNTIITATPHQRSKLSDRGLSAPMVSASFRPSKAG